MKNRLAIVLGLSVACIVLVGGCSSDSQRDTMDKGIAIPPTEDMVHAAPKGLSVSDSLALPPAPSPQVDQAPANDKPDVDTRLANLEAAVASLRADYDQIVPTFKTLSVNTGRLVSLMDRLDGRRALTPNLLEPAAGEEKGPSLTTSELTAPSAITKVRLGDHGDKTRIVLDVTNLSQYTYEIDNEERIMVIAMPHAAWEAGIQRHSIGSSLVESWTYQRSQDGGSILVLQLKRSVKIVNRNSLPANGDKGPRVYVDIAAV